MSPGGHRSGSSVADGCAARGWHTRPRRKIEADPAHPRLIKTVRNAGYVFTGQLQQYASGAR
jgi:hypothetical protein